MSEVRITKPVIPKMERPTQCRNPKCGKWFDLIGARSAIWCDTCAEKRQERVSRAAEEAERYRREDEQRAVRSPERERPEC